MIDSFKDRRTAAVAEGKLPKGFPENILRSAQRKLIMVAAACSLEDLRLPPSNRLELLKGDRRGQYSIRINRQFRICFEWENGKACNIEIVDYH